MSRDDGTTTPDRGRARIGVLVPYANQNLETDMSRLCPPGVSVHFARLGDYDIAAIPDEVQMAELGESDLSEPLRLIAGVRPNVVLYGCTSATLTHGPAFDRALARAIADTVGVPGFTAAGSLISAIAAFGADRIGFASPYVGKINDRAVAFLDSAGIATVSRADIGRELGHYGQGELTPDEVFELAVGADSPEAQAIVLSCTDMRSVETLKRIEAELDKPVIASNQAMMYRALTALGLDPNEVAGGGRLFRSGS